MGRKCVPYEEELLQWLQDPENAAAYLTAAIEDGDRKDFVLALRNVAQARGGMASVAEKAQLGRESLYKMLSERGNPEFRSIASVLHGMGLRLTVAPEEQKAA
jgi:probable addiction module antidote protein